MIMHWGFIIYLLIYLYFGSAIVIDDVVYILQLVGSANEVAAYLRTNIIQAELNEETGAYSKYPSTRNVKLRELSVFTFQCH